MCNDKWYASSLTKHDFLLASIVISLDLYYGKYGQGSASGDIYTWGRDRDDEMIEALRHSHKIWMELKDEMLDAWKAVNILTFMLDRITEPVPDPAQATGRPSALFETQDEKRNAAMTLGLLSSGRSPGPTSQGTPNPDGTRPNEPSQDSNGALNPSPLQFPSAPSPFSMFSPPGLSDMSQPMNLDWGAWDAYIQGTTMDTSGSNWSVYDPSLAGLVAMPQFSMQQPLGQQSQPQQSNTIWSAPVAPLSTPSVPDAPLAPSQTTRFDQTGLTGTSSASTTQSGLGPGISGFMGLPNMTPHSFKQHVQSLHDRLGGTSPKTES